MTSIRKIKRRAAGRPARRPLVLRFGPEDVAALRSAPFRYRLTIYDSTPDPDFPSLILERRKSFEAFGTALRKPA